MTDLSGYPIDYYSDADVYSADTDNRPLRQLNQRIVVVNQDVETVKTEVRDARGNKSTLDERISASLDDDGVLLPGAVSGITAADVAEETSVPPADDDRVWLTRAGSAKLEQISTRANRFLLGLGSSSEATDGVIRLMLGTTMRGSMVASSSGTTNLYLDTVFSADRLHEHRYGQEITRYNSSIAFLPNSEDDVIPGTIRVWLNGQLMSRRNYTEYSDATTGKILGVTITSNSELIDLSADLMWVDYECRVSLGSETSAFSQGIGTMARFEHTLDSAVDLRMVNLPLGASVQRPYQFWMIDVTTLSLAPPFENYCLFVTEYARVQSTVPATPPRGHVFASYGIDWDIISVSGSTYLRWRYDANPGATDGVPSQILTPDRWTFLVDQGAGTATDPADRFAPFNLVHAAHLDLLYLSTA